MALPSFASANAERETAPVIFCPSLHDQCIATFMGTFIIKSITSCDDNPFDRQERISWWDQRLIANAKIMVVGAGAIGNETLKNLALLGFQKILIVDFDTI